MMRLGMMLAAMLVMLTAGAIAHAKWKCAPFLCSRGLGRTTSMAYCRPI
jgi:hypothetical protein